MLSTMILMMICFFFGIYVGYKKQKSRRVKRIVGWVSKVMGIFKK